MDKKGYSNFWFENSLPGRELDRKRNFQFTNRVNDYLTSLQSQPLMYRKSVRLKHTHIGVIIKQVSLVYRIKPKSNTIELIAFIDNRQNPKRQNY
jgi:hypothetical protein